LPAGQRKPWSGGRIASLRKSDRIPAYSQQRQREEGWLNLTQAAAPQVHDFAFTGGVAVGVWATPRQTKDVDLCGSLPAEEVDRLLALRDGIRSGPEELPDIVRFRVDDWDVDLFVSKNRYDQECLRRALGAEIDGISVRVVTPEDLLIHKMIKLRHDRTRFLQDLADIRAVVGARGDGLDWDYVRKWVLPEESAWLKAVGRSTDEEVVSRFPGRYIP